jgi:hypothetical protein
VTLYPKWLWAEMGKGNHVVIVSFDSFESRGSDPNIWGAGPSDGMLLC